MSYWQRILFKRCYPKAKNKGALKKGCDGWLGVCPRKSLFLPLGSDVRKSLLNLLEHFKSLIGFEDCRD